MMQAMSAINHARYVEAELALNLKKRQENDQKFEDERDQVGEREPIVEKLKKLH